MAIIHSEGFDAYDSAPPREPDPEEQIDCAYLVVEQRGVPTYRQRIGIPEDGNWHQIEIAASRSRRMLLIGTARVRPMRYPGRIARLWGRAVLWWLSHAI
jgi:hypothetical protein